MLDLLKLYFSFAFGTVYLVLRLSFSLLFAVCRRYLLPFLGITLLVAAVAGFVDMQSIHSFWPGARLGLYICGGIGGVLAIVGTASVLSRFPNG